MTTQTGMQPAQNGCEMVVPRQRQRRRGATKKEKDPVALATGNGHSKATVSAIVAAVVAVEPELKPTKKLRRRFKRVALGPAVEVAEGHVRRWTEEILVFLDREDDFLHDSRRKKGWVHVEEADQHEVVLDRWTRRPSHRRVRILDEDGFPITGLTGWAETDRWLSEPTVIKFEEGDALPILIRVASPSERRCYPDRCVGDYRFIYAEPPKSPRPKIEWFPASDREKRKAFLVSLSEASDEIRATLAVTPEVVEVPEQWFKVELPALEYRFINRSTGETMFINPAASLEYPSGWPCKLVQPQPAKKVCWEKDGRFEVLAMPDPGHLYVQLSHHCTVWDQDWRGRRHERQLTDDGGEGTLPCGMWIPRHLLKSIGAKEADRRWLAVEVAYQYEVTFDEALIWLEGQKKN